MLRSILTFIRVVIGLWVRFVLTLIVLLIVLFSFSFGITLVKPGYNYMKALIKKNFYKNNASLEKINKELFFLDNKKEFKKYIVLGLLKVESGLTDKINLHGKPLNGFYNVDGQRYGGYLFKCSGNKDGNPVIAKLGNKDVSNYIYKKYYGKRNYIGHYISVCKIYNHIKNKKDKELFKQRKTSYAGAIGIFQMMPINIDKKMGLHKTIGKGLSFSFYTKAVYNFLELDKINLNINNPDELKKCLNLNNCKQLRKAIFNYNHTNRYVGRVIKEAIQMWYADKWGMFSSPVRKVNGRFFEPYITQGYHSSPNRFHPAIDISIEYKKYNVSKQRVASGKDKIEIIYNLNKEGNCYFIYWDKKNKLSDRIGNGIVCINDNNILLYAHLSKFNQELLKKGKPMYNNQEVVGSIINALINNNPSKTFKISYKYYIPNIIKVKNVKPRTLLGYMGSSGHSSGPHLHYINVLRTYGNKFKILYENKMKEIIRNFICF